MKSRCENAINGADIEMIGATEDDYDFIAHARQDIPLLLEEFEHRKAMQKL